jgi:hypothetical protein
VKQAGDGTRIVSTMRWEITLMADVRLGHRVIEVGTDYVVVVDVAGVTETRIPIYSIKSIVRIKVPRR